MKLTHIQFLLRFMCCFGGLGIICMVVACLSTNSATSTIDLYMLLEKTHTTAYFILFCSCLIIGVLALLALQALDYRQATDRKPVEVPL